MIYLDYFREISLISGKFSIIDMQKTPSTLLKNFYARDYKVGKNFFVNSKNTSKSI